MDATISGITPNGHGLKIDLTFPSDMTVQEGFQGYIENVRDSTFTIASVRGSTAVAHTTFALKAADLGAHKTAVINCDRGTADVSGPITGRVIGRQGTENASVVLVAAGREQGVKVGMKGKFDGLSSVHLEVIVVSDTVCKATVDAPADQVSGYRNVTFSPSGS